MKRAAVLLLAGLALGCPKKPEGSEKGLLSEVKQRLSERDGKVTSYHLVGRTRQGAQEVGFEFFYRHPNRMRGLLTHPVGRAFSWDGQRLFEVVEAEKRFITYENKLPPEKSLLFLTQTFAPFAPEGFRAPLLLKGSASVTRVSHPRAPEAVEVKLEAREESGAMLPIAYVLRWPSLDFLERRTGAGEAAVEIRVVEEHCEEALRLCFPKKLVQRQGANEVATTELSKVEINPALPAESFTLAPPEGYEVRTQELVER